MRALLVASALGLAQAGWAAFQWYELLVARRGGEVVCGSAAADTAPRSGTPRSRAAVHAATGLPVAGLGRRVRAGRVRAAAGRADPARAAARGGRVAGRELRRRDRGRGRRGPLLAASLRFGHLCRPAAASYLLALAYAAAVCLGDRAAAAPARSRAARRSRRHFSVSPSRVLLRTGPAHAAEPDGRGHRTRRGAPRRVRGRQRRRRSARSRPSSTSIPPEARQLLSDTLAAYAASAECGAAAAAHGHRPAAEPRLRLTEWTDTLCSHCKQTARDARCSSAERFGARRVHASRRTSTRSTRRATRTSTLDDSQPLRCLAARVQICAEGKPGAFDFVGELFDRQGSLTEPMLWELAEPLVPRAELEACARSPETEKKLQDDIAWARGSRHHGHAAPASSAGARRSPTRRCSTCSR